MTDQWEERISPNSDALLVAEHEVRYAWARGAVETAGTWCDIGCGTGAASSRAFADALPERVVLVDADESALEEAGRALAAARPTTRRVDLTSPADLGALGDLLDAGPGPNVLTCFEVIEHLSDFGPAIEWFVRRSEQGDTVVLSVPNDAFTSVQNPYHVTMWGSSTVEELRRMLPAGHAVAVQAALEGSYVSDGSDPTLSARLDDLSTPAPLQFLLAFGPGVELLTPTALVLPTDVAGRRVWERQREVDNLYYSVEAARVPELEAEIARLREELARVAR